VLAAAGACDELHRFRRCQPFAAPALPGVGSQRGAGNLLFSGGALDFMFRRRARFVASQNNESATPVESSRLAALRACAGYVSNTPIFGAAGLAVGRKSKSHLNFKDLLRCRMLATGCEFNSQRAQL
jgi:hypothetical protein